MKILCLHGACSNANTFRIQLSSFARALEEAGKSQHMELIYRTGAHEASPPPPPSGLPHHMFGPRPLREFLSASTARRETTTLLPPCFRPGDGVEDVSDMVDVDPAALDDCMGEIFNIVDGDQEIEGILGYLDGASVAASFILEEMRRSNTEGRRRRIKLGIFFSGRPGFRRDGSSMDDGAPSWDGAACDEDVIDIPTVHVLGSKDADCHRAVSLFDSCCEDRARLFDLGSARGFLKDETTWRELSAVVGEALQQVQVGS